MLLSPCLTRTSLQGYNHYNFPEALWQIEKSTQILENLLNSKHVFIAASWRLKALLLEGLAANTENEQVTEDSVRVYTGWMLSGGMWFLISTASVLCNRVQIQTGCVNRSGVKVK